MSMPSGMDPIDRLRAADPVHVDDVPDASLARVTASVQEHIMTDNYDPNVRPTRGPLFKYGGLVLGGALALAIVVGNGFGIGGQVPGGSTAPTTDPGGAAGGGGAASCMVYDPATLPMNDVVFDGTVTAVDGDQITFEVNEGWKGAEGSITLTAPEEEVALTGPLPEFEVGGRYLVTAYGSTINACGYTLDWDADTAAEWAAAF
jgi:hypothetical protein